MKLSWADSSLSRASRSAGVDGPCRSSHSSSSASGVLAAEDALGELVERDDVPRLVYGIAPDLDAVEPADAGAVFVPPGDVVLGAGRVDGDGVARGGQALGDEPAVELRPAHDLGAVALDDESDFHETAALPSVVRHDGLGMTTSPPIRKDAA